MSERTTLFRINGHVIVTRWQVLLRGEVVIDPVSDIYDFLRSVDLVSIAASTGVNLEIGPDDRLLVEERSKDLLHEFVFHVHQLSEDEDLVAVLTSICELPHLTFDFIFQVLPDLGHVYHSKYIT